MEDIDFLPYAHYQLGWGRVTAPGGRDAVYGVPLFLGNGDCQPGGLGVLS